LCAVASALVCAVKFVNSFARSQHLFYIVAKHPLTWIQIFRRILLLFQFIPKCHHLICWW